MAVDPLWRLTRMCWWKSFRSRERCSAPSLGGCRLSWRLSAIGRPNKKETGNCFPVSGEGLGAGSGAGVNRRPLSRVDSYLRSFLSSQWSLALRGGLMHFSMPVLTACDHLIHTRECSGYVAVIFARTFFSKASSAFCVGRIFSAFDWLSGGPLELPTVLDRHRK